MTVVVVARSISSDELLERTWRYIPRGWPTSCWETETGAAIVAGDGDFAVSGHWLVAGRPASDAWGLPGDALPCTAISDELERFGPAALQLASGPFVAVDLRTLAIVRALNGIIPAFRGVGETVAVGTRADAVTAASIGAPRAVPSGTIAEDHDDVLIMDEVVEALDNVTWSGIAAEVRSRLARLGELRPFSVAETGSDDRRSSQVWIGEAGEPIFTPSLEAVGRSPSPLDEYRRLRDEVSPMLWWRARLLGKWLHAPAFERPMLDTVLLVAGHR